MALSLSLKKESETSFHAIMTILTYSSSCISESRSTSVSLKISILNLSPAAVGCPRAGIEIFCCIRLDCDWISSDLLPDVPRPPLDFCCRMIRLLKTTINVLEYNFPSAYDLETLVEISYGVSD